MRRSKSSPFGRRPFQFNPRSKRDYRQSPGPPPLDIRQNLRGPKPSAAGPFGETDVSRPVQCFKCRMGSSQKTLPIPFKLYPGGNGKGQFLPDDGKGTRRSSSTEPVSSTIDMKILQVAEKYHNPDPLLRLIGPAN